MTSFLLALTISKPQLWVFAVSCLDYKSQAFNTIPDGSRADRKLLDYFRKSGVPENRITYITGKRASSQKIDFEFREILGKQKKDDLLIIYYFGHGYIQDKYLQLASYNSEVGSSGWQMVRAFRQIDRLFRGQRILFIADACKSGLLVDFAAKSKAPVTILASAIGEQDVPEGWEFTECLLEGFKQNSDWDSALDFVAEKSTQFLGHKPTLFIPNKR